MLRGKFIKIQVACMALCVMVAAHAQTAVEGIEGAPESSVQSAGEPGPPPGRKIVPQQQPAASARVYRIGSFLAYPEIVASGMYDDNVYATQANKISDFATVFSPAVWLQSNWSRHVLKFEAGADSTRYHSQTSQNSNDYRYSVEGRYDISPQTNVYGGFRRAQEHEDRESPDFRNGYYPTEYHSLKGYAGWFHRFDRLSLRIGGTSRKFEFNNVPFTNGVINNTDRNRMQYTGGARVSYELSPNSEIYLQGAVDDRRYQNKPDDAGYIRDSNGERLLVGSRLILPRRVRADLFVGHMAQRYQDPRLGQVSAPMLGANVSWYRTDTTTFSAYADRTIEETTVFQTTPAVLPASSYVNSYIALTADHKYSDRFSMSANFSYSRNNFQGYRRVDKYYSNRVGGLYQLAPGIFFCTSFQHQVLRWGTTTQTYYWSMMFFLVAISRFPMMGCM